MPGTFAQRQASEARVREANLTSLALELGIDPGQIRTETKLGQTFAILPDGSRRTL